MNDASSRDVARTPEEEIRRVIAVYAQLLDDGKFDEWIELFTDDATFSYRNEETKSDNNYVGREAIRGWIGASMSEDRRAMHLCGNSVIDVSGTEARAVTDLVLHQGLTIASTARYIDRFVLQSNKWLIAHRRVEYMATAQNYFSTDRREVPLTDNAITKTQSGKTDTSLAWSYFRLLTEGQLEEALALLDDSGSLWGFPPRPIRSLKDMKVGVRALWSEMPMRFTLHSEYISGDRVFLEMESHATRPDGEPYNNWYCYIVVVQGDKIVHMREYMDTIRAKEMTDAVSGWPPPG